jgi:probable F420-dependent oxidoreductase
MANIDLGRIGAVVSPGDDGFVDQAVQLEGLGYSTIWVTGGPMQSLDQIAQVVHATEAVRIASGIIAVVRYPAEEVLALYRELEASHPGRLVVGLGGAHGEKPFDVLNAYLDRLDEPDGIPRDRRILAALGPRMQRLGRDRAGGAYAVLATPGYMTEAKALLGDATLALDQIVVVETDADAARAVGRTTLGFLGTLPAYQANFARMGFSADEIGEHSARLVDGLIPWGDAITVATRVEEQLTAGVDHVAVSIQTPAGTPFPLNDWTAVATQLGLT